MALSKPILLNQVAFDATVEHIFQFSVSGVSAQIVSNKLTIRDNSTNAIVYDKKQDTFRYEHILPEGTLTNGKYYNAVITVFDNKGTESPASIPIQFWCYSTPTVEFTNIPQSGVIDNASFNFQFSYNQSEGERLNSYVLLIYNIEGTVISTSGVKYAEDGTPPFSSSYLFSGFENNTVYFIDLVVTTIEGTIISTGKRQISVKYIRPDLFTLVELKNNCDEGYITIKSNIILIEGESNPDPPVYIDGQELDLTQNGSWAEWNKGFNISGDMLSRLWFRNPNPYSTIMEFSNLSGQNITARFMLGFKDVDSQEQQAYVEIYVSSIKETPYYIFSNFVPVRDNRTQYVLYLKRINNIYSIEIL